MRSPKKIYYVPGIISLMFLPFFSGIYFTHIIKKNDYRMLEISYLSLVEDTISRNFKKELSKRSFIIYNLKDKSHTNNTIIDKAFTHLREIYKGKNNVAGVEIKLNNTYFNDYIYILNACVKNKIKIYAIYNDIFYGFYWPYEQIKYKRSYSVCGSNVNKMIDFVEESKIINGNDGLLGKMKIYYSKLFGEFFLILSFIPLLLESIIWIKQKRLT